MTLEVEKKRGRPFLLSAKVPRNLEGCHADGFDVEAWARQDLVDILTLGTRSFEVDVGAFRRLTAGRNIKLQASIDDYHATDGYNNPPVEVFRGVCSNWWHQGIDGIMTMNWNNAPPEKYRPCTISQLHAYKEIGSPETLADKDKTFVAERRLGHHKLMIEGFFGRNTTSQLPLRLMSDGRPASVTVRIGDNVRAYADRIKEVTLRAVFFGAREGDEIKARLNGGQLAVAVRDDKWKDPQIFSPGPQSNLGMGDAYKVDPKQKLLRLDFSVPPRQCRLGENQVDILIAGRAAYKHGESVLLEKLEVHVDYE